MMGNFETQRPSPEQLESCARLTAWLCQQHHIDLAHVEGHKDAAKGQTSCPGKDFYRYLEGGENATFRTWVKRLLDGQDRRSRRASRCPAGRPSSSARRRSRRRLHQRRRVVRKLADQRLHVIEKRLRDRRCPFCGSSHSRGMTRSPPA
jgi:hypothetical protein